MKKLIPFLMILMATEALTSPRIEIAVKEVGLSKNSKRVFVVSEQQATETECSVKDHFSIAIPEAEAYLFYSTALTAMKDGKKMRIQYSATDCISNSPIVEVFWNLNQ
jgi:hypothetical protein